MKIQFALQSYMSRSKPVAAQKCVNLYPEKHSPDAKDLISLVGSPGLLLFSTIGNGPIQGLHTMDKVLYAVSGGTLYSINSNGTGTSLGFCGFGRVSMADNGTTLVIVNGSVGYSYSVAGGLAKITDADFYPSKTVTFQDGYFIFERSGTGQFYISNLYSVDFLGADFATAEGAPDDTVAVLCDTRELWLFGEHTIEVWWNSGATFPFERYQGAFIEKGCIAPYSVAKIDNTVFWLCDDLSVYAAKGFVPTKISNPGIDYAIETYTKVDDAIGYTYIQEGHHFYVLTFPSENATWVFDGITELWHERSSDGGRHRSNNYIKAYGKHLVGDYENGNIYQLDLDTYTDNGSLIVRDAVSPAIHNEVDNVFMSRFQIDIESGTGLVTGQGSDPQAMLRWSDDGGRTWSNEHWSSMGKLGEYLYRVVWRRLGRFRQRIFWLRISDPIKVSIISAYAKTIPSDE